ncbi:bacterial low temperature requirement A protein LtrA [Variibacter gotjawalensis]|uniref:Bacterial low temperature requirement A protein LtrA n=1 Tax=Variibacter gotjawalensis TaxID=1333996 RepID=A0A0S3PX55_9BRAD|nr:low temperature requirement protein A [Variibacter gotjawalensis]NIK46325.1 low temperature requirement protein LtrA [Variibacter gotjawalensis]RZS48235.1 low temperature requirement protein LtrA [Variibacter gotjawalensis]BAT60495.1 bacterial low temperature requirement A protein LtrA [Variibacter gotjawalensis]
MRAKRNLLRSESEVKVTNVELFFDLVFVFAVTQLSHNLLEHFSPGGVLQTGLIFLAVWWVWIYTTWCTNWLNPDLTAVRIMLFALMLAGLVLTTSIPKAFGPLGLVFACTYAGMQVGRSLFMMWSLRAHSPENYRNFQRITAWCAVSAMFWISGGFAEGNTRFALWLIAIAIEYVSPALGFRFPGLGRSSTEDWNVSGEHLAERVGLFIIIALGESILVTGATAAKAPASVATWGAFFFAFLASVAMWWIYFNVGAERAAHSIEHSDDPGRIARTAYTYIPLLMIAGIIVAAVGDELVLAHPTGHVDGKTAICLLVAPALFLVGTLLFKRVTWGRFPLSHLVGLALLVVAAPFYGAFEPWVYSGITSLILCIVAAWETFSAAEPSRKT